MNDLISKQALAEHKFTVKECEATGEAGAYRIGWNDAIDAIIDNEPSAELEPLTDREQRIFLAAMEREEKICKEIDQYTRGAYEDSLVYTCREIKRKVKNALWT